MRSLIHGSVFAAVVLSSSWLAASEAPDGTAFTHTVLSVDGPDLLRIKYCGLPLQVRLANVQTKGAESETQTLKYLREVLHPGSVIRFEIESELDSDGNVMPAPGHVFVGNTHINLELLKRGLAITDGRSKKFAAMAQNAQAEAMSAKAGLWAPGAANAVAAAKAEVEVNVAPPDYKGPVVADLNSKEYHLPGSRFARSIRSGAKIDYRNLDEAERAGKVPCPFSFPDRAKLFAEKVAAAQSAKVGSAPQSTDDVVSNSRKALAEALQFMGEARTLSRTDNQGSNRNWKKAAKLLNDSLDRLTPVADANPNNEDIQKLAEEMTLNLYSCNKYQSL